MARIGSFGGATEVYGQPISVIHPPDNNVTKSRYHDLIRSNDLYLTQKERDDLQAQTLELLGLLQLARNLAN